MLALFLGALLEPAARSARDDDLRLPFPVVELALAREQRLAVAARPEADLAAVGIVDDGQRALGREDEHARRLGAPVDQRMGAPWPLAEDGDVAARELALALRGAQCRRPLIRRAAIPSCRTCSDRATSSRRAELIEARPERTRTEPGADPGGAVTEALAVVLGVPVLLALEVEHLHAPDCRAGRPEVCPGDIPAHWPSPAPRR